MHCRINIIKIVSLVMWDISENLPEEHYPPMHKLREVVFPRGDNPQYHPQPRAISIVSYRIKHNDIIHTFNCLN